jgi:hypothetical protein
MTASRVRPAIVIWLLALLVIVASGWVLLPFPRRPTGWEEILWALGFGAGFTTVGAILVDRRPREPVSRITLAIGLMVVAAVGLRAVAVAIDARPGALPPAGAVAAMTAQSLQSLAFMTAGGFLLVRFPDGSDGGRLTRLVTLVYALVVVVTAIGVFAPGALGIGWMSAADNPIGIELIGAELVAGLESLALGCYAVSLGLAVVVIARRYRRSGRVQRAQIRWVAAASVLPVVLFPFLFVVDWMWTPWFLSTALPPIAIGIAILRYRLYDIDRIIGRTVAYAIVTAFLAGIFVASNLVLQALVVGVTGSGDTLIVAASTLLVAALFQPVRRRVQAPIDRRFNREHLDAERVVGTFARQARDEVDLGRLREAVVGVVVESVRPAGADVWLRGDRRTTGPVSDATVAAR